MNRDYRESHKRNGKGELYDSHYATMAHRRYLWGREQHALNCILETYLKDREIHLLDFACGTGRLTSFLESRVTSSTGVDISEPMLERAKQKLRRTEIIQADLTRRNVLNGRRFNLITAFRFFLNAQDELRMEAMRALVRLLDEDGYLVFNVHRIRSSLGVTIGHTAAAHRPPRPDGPRVMSLSEVRHLVARVGLEIADVHSMGYLNLPKVRLPERICGKIDDLAGRLRWLLPLAENAVFVCRHRARDRVRRGGRSSA